MKDKAVPKNVSMYQEQWTLVDQVAAATGLNSTSAAVRFIISEYFRLKGNGRPGSPSLLPSSKK